MDSKTKHGGKITIPHGGPYPKVCGDSIVYIHLKPAISNVLWNLFPMVSGKIIIFLEVIIQMVGILPFKLNETLGLVACQFGEKLLIAYCKHGVLMLSVKCVCVWGGNCQPNNSNSFT